MTVFYWSRGNFFFISCKSFFLMCKQIVFLYLIKQDEVNYIQNRLEVALKCKILIILVTNLWPVYLLPANLKSLRFTWKRGNEAPPLSNCYNVFIYSYYMCDF